MLPNETAGIVITTAIQIHRDLGTGLFESTYSKVLYGMLLQRGMIVEREKYVDINFEGVYVERAYCIDMIVNHHLILELKSIEKVAPVHLKQLHTYLRLSNIRHGLLINFGQVTLRDGLHRVVNGYATPP